VIPAAKATAKSALTQAKNTRSSTLLRVSRAIQTAHGQVSSASAALSNTKASTAVNAQGARAGSIASTKAQIASAQVQVDQAMVRRNSWRSYGCEARAARSGLRPAGAASAM